MKNFYWLLLLPLFLFGKIALFAQGTDQCFTLELSATEANPGDTICLDITTNAFNKILSTQYSMHWNVEDLKYVAIENLNLPNLSFTNFGLLPDLVDNGQVPLSWVDQSLNGVSLPDGTVLYSICFEVLAEEAGFYPVFFSENPTIIEFISQDFLELNANLINGGVQIPNEVAVPPFRIVNTCPTPASCTGAATAFINLSAEGGTPPYTYSWTGPMGFSSTEEDIQNLAPGAYQVTIEDQENRINSAEFYVSTPGNIGLEANTVNVNCGTENNGSISLHVINGSSDYSFLWSNGSTAESIQNLEAGTYSVTVEDLLTGCSISEQYTISYEELVWAFSYECGPTNTTVYAVVWAGGTPPYTFVWSDGTVETNDFISSITVADTGTYSLTISDQTGCEEVIESLEFPCNTSISDLSVYGSNEEASQGDTVCVDIKVDGFTDIMSAQFSLNWNPLIADFVSIEGFNLPELDLSNFGISPLNEDGILTFAWFEQNLNGVTLEDGTAIFQVCFVALASSGITSVSILDNPTLIEFIDSSSMEVPANIEAGSISIGVINQNIPALSLYLPNEVTYPSTSRCLKVRVNEFTSIQSFQYSHDWDPEILSLTNVQIGNLPGLSQEDFDLSLIDQGSLTLSWQGNGPTSLPAFTNLYELCFEAVGAPGSTGAISFSDNPLPIIVIDDAGLEISNPDLQIGTLNILDTTPSTGPLSFCIAPQSVTNGDEICVPIQVENFVDLIGMQFSMHWDTSMLQFSGIDNINLPDLSFSSFGLPPALPPGTLTCSWIQNTLQGVTLTDSSTIFEVCFLAVGNTGANTSIFFDDVPTPIEVFNASSQEVPVLLKTGFISIIENYVWPGDMNLDQVVTHYDLLPLGIGFNQNGPTRSQASLSWESQTGIDWLQGTPFSNINYKNLDATGNGLINAEDILAIEANWGLMVNNINEDGIENRPAPGFSTFDPNTPSIYLYPDTFDLAETGTLAIMLGDAINPAEDIYGIAFSIIYNGEAIVSSSVSASFEDSWLGTPGNDLITIYRNNPEENKIDIAITRTDRENISGSGQIGILHITIEDVILRSGMYPMDFEIEGIRLINNIEVVKNIVPRRTTSYVDLLDGLNEPVLAQQITLYPNPAEASIWINSSAVNIKQVALYNTNGQYLKSFTNQNRLPIHDLQAGVYILQFICEEGVASKRFIKQ